MGGRPGGNARDGRAVVLTPMIELIVLIGPSPVLQDAKRPAVGWRVTPSAEDWQAGMTSAGLSLEDGEGVAVPSRRGRARTPNPPSAVLRRAGRPGWWERPEPRKLKASRGIRSWLLPFFLERFPRLSSTGTPTPDR